MLKLTEFNIKIVHLFLTWYLVEVPRQILQGVIDYIETFAQMFSFLYLLRTIIKPWKNLVKSYPDKGLDVQKIFEVWTTNMVARTVGAMVRIATIGVGGFIEFCVILAGGACLIFWYGFPVITLFVVILFSA
jgi:hypothetical protein